MKKLNQIFSRWKNIYFIYLIGFVVGIFTGIYYFEGKVNTFNPENVSYIEVFVNNLNVGSLLLIGGLITGGTLSLFLIMANGCIVGNIIFIAISNGNIKSLLTGLLPHFFFELIGLFSFAVVGTFTGYIFFKFLTKKIHTVNFSQLMTDGLWLIAISIVSLFLGAVIEDFISHVY